MVGQSVKAPLLAVGLLSGLLACGAALAQEGRRFDGSWGIEVVTTRGSCDRAYRYYVEINGGAVRPRSMMGEAGAVAGQVNPSGRIDTRLGSNEDLLIVRGSLESEQGTGTWSAPGRGCTGRWVAEKRGVTAAR